VSVANATNETDGTAKGRAPWMPFWGTDFMAATLGWSASERGAYMILLWAAWEGDGLPSDPERLFRLDPDIRSAWHLLEDKFPVYGDGKRRNPRQERERGEMRESGKRNADRARKAAAARWDAPSNARSNAPAMLGSCQTQTQTHTQSLSETEPIRDTLNGVAVEPVSSVNDPKPSRAEARPRIGTDADFKAFWDIYPRRVGKGAARAAFFKALPLLADEMELIEEAAARHMIQAVEAYASKPETRALEQKFIPHPVTWLNQRRYIDELEAIRKAIFR